MSNSDEAAVLHAAVRPDNVHFALGKPHPVFSEAIVRTILADPDAEQAPDIALEIHAERPEGRGWVITTVTRGALMFTLAMTADEYKAATAEGGSNAAE